VVFRPASHPLTTGISKRKHIQRKHHRYLRGLLDLSFKAFHSTHRIAFKKQKFYILSSSQRNSLKDKMYLAIFLTSLLTSLPITLSAPVSTTPELYGEPYNCGYVLTIRNSSAYAGISAYPPAQAECTAIYYNDTIPGYQDAYAYSLFGGCECSFHL